MPFRHLCVFSLLLLAGCQAAVGPVQAPVSSAPRGVNRLTSASGVRPLALNPALERELAQPDEEAEPAGNSFQEQVVRQTLGTTYVNAHSYYYQTLDQGKSSVEAILAHDGHSRAAELVTRWRTELGQNALWPDQQSTTYGGPWPALEHGLLRNGSGWFTFASADKKAEEYYQRALKTWKPGLPADHPEQAESWAWLGRSSHFLHDMTVPFHTMSLLRPSQLLYHTAYEKSCDTLFERYLPSRNHNPGNVWAQGPYPATGTWGVYYAPGTSAATMVKQTADQARRFYGMVNERENAQKANWERTRAVMIPLGAKASAGMILRFLADTNAR
ncbi:MAG: hypothetical protein ACO1RX_22950 [Candidatus Sericytochromatia bacterium]